MVDVVETCQCFADGELAVEGQLLGHVADARAGDARLGRARLAAEDEHLARVETAPADDATQQRRLAATAGSQQSVTARARPIKQSAHQQHWLAPLVAAAAAAAAPISGRVPSRLIVLDRVPCQDLVSLTYRSSLESLEPYRPVRQYWLLIGRCCTNQRPSTVARHRTWI